MVYLPDSSFRRNGTSLDSELTKIIADNATVSAGKCLVNHHGNSTWTANDTKTNNCVYGWVYEKEAGEETIVTEVRMKCTLAKQDTPGNTLEIIILLTRNTYIFVRRA